MAADGSSAKNLTDGVGRKENLVFRYIRLEPVEAGEERGIDPAKPLLLRAQNELTRDGGFYRDRIDGGVGSDTRFGYGGDDRVFGATGNGNAGDAIGSNEGTLVNGATFATGKVGQTLIARLLAAPDWRHARVRALCHNRMLPEGERLEVVRGSIADRATAERAMAGVTHVVHLATCKETPEDVMDVTVRGLFWLLEEFRQSPDAARFLLIGGDAGMGHFFHPRPAPVTRIAFALSPGKYALRFGIRHRRMTAEVLASRQRQREPFVALRGKDDDGHRSGGEGVADEADLGARHRGRATRSRWITGCSEASLWSGA